MFSFLRSKKKIKKEKARATKEIEIDIERQSFLSQANSTLQQSIIKQKNWLKTKNSSIKFFENKSRPPKINDFTMLQTLGKGSQGKVVSVESKKTGKIYALKILSKRFLERANLVPQTLRSLNIMKRIDHKNIVKYYGCFEDENNLYLILEKVEEVNLFSKLKKEKKFKENENFKEMVFRIFKAVNYLHTLDPPIIHRDLKPENILFCSGNPKIIDFCLSSSLTKNRKTYCGTRDYLLLRL